MGDPAKLVALCASLARLPTPKDPTGVTYAALEPEAAIAACKAATRADPNSAASKANLARALFKAVDTLNDAIERAMTAPSPLASKTLADDQDLSAKYAEEANATATLAAKAGDPQGAYTLAYRDLQSALSSRFVVSYIFQDALNLLRPVAARRYPLAENLLGWMFATGEGLPRDDAQALVWFERGATDGSAEAQINAALMRSSGRGGRIDLAAAARWLKRAADQGDERGRILSGWALETGQGVARDPARAANLYRAGADQGDPAAQTLLSLLYERGEGVPRDLAQAMAWRAKAAAGNYPWRVAYNAGNNLRFLPQTMTRTSGTGPSTPGVFDGPGEDMLSEAMRKSFASAPAQNGPALERLARAQLAVVGEAEGAGTEDMALACETLARALSLQGRFEEAIAPAQCANAVRVAAANRGFLNLNDPRLADSLTALGNALDRTRHEMDGYFIHQAALKLRLADPTLATSRMADDDVGLARWAIKTAKLDQAEALYRAALAIREKTQGPDDSESLADVQALAGVLREEGDLEGAETMSRRALAISERTEGGQAAVSAALTVLGKSLDDQRRYAEAADVYRRALEIEGALTPSDPRRRFDLADRVAFDLERQGLLSLAESDRRGLLRDALARNDGRALDDQYEGLIRILKRRGDKAGVEAEARAWLADLAAGRGPLDLGSWPRGDALGILAETLETEDRFVEAEGFRRQAIVACDGNAFCDSEDRAALGHTLDLEKKWSLSGAIFSALRAELTTSNRNDDDRALIQSAVAEHEVEIGDLAGGARDLRAACATLTARRDIDTPQIDMDGPDSYAVSCSQTQALRLQAYASRGGGRPAADHPPALLAEGFLAAQRALRSDAGAALSQVSARALAGSEGAAEEAAAYEKSLAAFSVIIQRSRNAILGGGTRSDISYAAWSSASERIKAVADRLAKAAPRYWDYRSPEPLALTELHGSSGLLHPDEALMLFMIPAGADHGLVFVASGEESAWARIGMSGDEIAGAVRCLRRQIDPTAFQGIGLTHGALSSESTCPKGFDRWAAYHLYQALLGDPRVARVAASRRTWLIVPSGPLVSLPPAVLVTAPPTPRGTAWLIKAHALAVLPDATALRTLRRRLASTSPDRAVPLLSFANPYFGPGPSAAPPADSQARSALFKDGRPTAEALKYGLPQLPGTLAEARAVAAGLGASPDSLVTGKQASKAELMARNADGRLGRARVVEFATHGLFPGEIWGLAEPALALAAGPSPTDTLLTSSEAAGLHLHADWVLLSACDTASPGALGSQGISGLSRAFLFAGARSLLVSQWHVNDEVTGLMIPRVVTALGVSHAEALRQATLSILNDPKIKDGGEPRLWGPFVLVGDPGD